MLTLAFSLVVEMLGVTVDFSRRSINYPRDEGLRFATTLFSPLPRVYSRCRETRSRFEIHAIRAGAPVESGAV